VTSDVGARTPPVEATTDRAAARKHRTRQRLVDAAREVFNHEGFYAAKLADIPSRAGLGTGTFYNHFSSKEDVFHAVMQDVLVELQSSRPAPSTSAGRRPIDSIRDANAAYLRAYRRNARLMTDCSALARSRPDMRDIKVEIDTVFEDRLAGAIRHWQEVGVAHSDVDPLYAANALGYMVDRFADEFYVFGKPYDEEKAVEVLTVLWARALGVTGT
jgi:AcrR family transcriptional regulator